MDEFLNRLSAQRKILKILNSCKQEEELFGLSKAAIERWVSNNQIGNDSEIVKLVYYASEKLFFLANKSQEQISIEYQTLSKEVSHITESIKRELYKK